MTPRPRSLSLPLSVADGSQRSLAYRFVKRQWYVRLRNGLVAVQSLARRDLQRRWWLATRRWLLATQGLARAMLAKRRVWVRRREARATRVQAWFRGCRSRRGQVKFFSAAARIQALGRRFLQRRRFLAKLAEFREQAKLASQLNMLKAKLAEEQAQREREAEEMAKQHREAAAVHAAHMAGVGEAKVRQPLRKRITCTPNPFALLPPHFFRLVL